MRGAEGEGGRERNFWEVWELGLEEEGAQGEFWEERPSRSGVDVGECGSLRAQETPSQVGRGPRTGCSQLRGDTVWMEESAWPQASNCRGPL